MNATQIEKLQLLRQDLAGVQLRLTEAERALKAARFNYLAALRRNIMEGIRSHEANYSRRAVVCFALADLEHELIGMIQESEGNK